MKQPKPDRALPAGKAGMPSLAQPALARRARKETNLRVEELKMRLFQLSEQHMDQAVRLIKRWLSDKG